MTLMDDIKKKTEESLKTLKETAQDIAFNVEKQAKIGKKKYLDIAKLQRTIQKLYKEIGEYVYDQFTSGRIPTIESPFLKERIGAITKLFLEIKEIEEEIEEIKRTVPSRHGEDKNF